MLRRNGIYGLAEVYVRCKDKGYTRSLGSMCKQVRKRGYIQPKIYRKSYAKYERMDGRYPGDKVEVDIKYVPEECVRLPSYGDEYYQIIAIDECSRIKIVKEKNTYETSKYLLELEENMGFKINTIQVDNGYEFVNDTEKTNRKTRFQIVAKSLRMKIKRTRPYSPWQNRKVELSHREDGKILYGRKIFISKKELKRAEKKHMQRYNSTAKTSLNFKSPNKIVSEYFSKCNVCLTTKRSMVEVTIMYICFSVNLDVEFRYNKSVLFDILNNALILVNMYFIMSLARIKMNYYNKDIHFK